MNQITVISGPERRRVWTDQQKRELVAAVSVPGANVAEIACCQQHSNFPRNGISRNFGARSCHNPGPKQFEAGAPIHGTLYELELIDFAFDWTGAPGQRQCGSNRVDVAVKASCKRADRAPKRLGKPWIKCSDFASDQDIVEPPRQVCRVRDLWRCGPNRVDEPAIGLVEDFTGRGQ